MKKNKFQIALFDDEPSIRNAFYHDLISVVPSAQFDIKVIDPEEFNEALDNIKERQVSFRKTGDWDNKKNNVLDNVSILIIDYDLFDAHPFLKASEVAYLARCFTTCGLIVTINEAGHNPFDLTLGGHLYSFADLHIGQDQLSSPYLWGKKTPKDSAKIPKDLYSWQWPDLLDYYKNLKKRINDAQKAISNNEPIEKSLGFDNGTFNSLTRSVSQFIGDGASNVTYLDFALSDSGFEFKDRQTKIKSKLNPEIIARLGAARVAKWLEYSLLMEQDLLIDAPHLVSRLPQLLVGDPKKIASWNATTKKGASAKVNVNQKILKPFQFEKDYWFYRPVWYWRKIMENKEIDQVREPWKISYPEWVFCEDASAFSTKYSEFVSKAQSAYSRRYVRIFDNVDYEPRNRLSL